MEAAIALTEKQLEDRISELALSIKNDDEVIDKEVPEDEEEYINYMDYYSTGREYTSVYSARQLEKLAPIRTDRDKKANELRSIMNTSNNSRIEEMADKVLQPWKYEPPKPYKIPSSSLIYSNCSGTAYAHPYEPPCATLEGKVVFAFALAGSIACPCLIMHYVHSDVRDILAAYGGTLGGFLLGGFLGTWPALGIRLAIDSIKNRNSNLYKTKNL